MCYSILMQINIGDLLKTRLEAYSKEGVAETVKREGVDYNKRWSKGVQYFVDRINADRKGTSYPPVKFYVVRSRLVALKEIEDLRWFYFVCNGYAKKGIKEGKTFSQCFWGATDPKKDRTFKQVIPSKKFINK